MSQKQKHLCLTNSPLHFYSAFFFPKSKVRYSKDLMWFFINFKWQWRRKLNTEFLWKIIKLMPMKHRAVICIKRCVKTVIVKCCSPKVQHLLFLCIDRILNGRWHWMQYQGFVTVKWEYFSFKKQSFNKFQEGWKKCV